MGCEYGQTTNAQGVIMFPHYGRVALQVRIQEASASSVEVACVIFFVYLCNIKTMIWFEIKSCMSGFCKRKRMPWTRIVCREAYRWRGSATNSQCIPHKQRLRLLPFRTHMYLFFNSWQQNKVMSRNRLLTFGFPRKLDYQSFQWRNILHITLNRSSVHIGNSWWMFFRRTEDVRCDKKCDYLFLGCLLLGRCTDSKNQHHGQGKVCMAKSSVQWNEDCIVK